MNEIIEVRIKKVLNAPTRVTLVYSGVANTSVHWTTSNWRDFLANRGLLSAPRIWE
jgi:hypothetical protein